MKKEVECGGEAVNAVAFFEHLFIREVKSIKDLPSY